MRSRGTKRMAGGEKAVKFEFEQNRSIQPEGTVKGENGENGDKPLV